MLSNAVSSVCYERSLPDRYSEVTAIPHTYTCTCTCTCTCTHKRTRCTPQGDSVIKFWSVIIYISWIRVFFLHYSQYELAGFIQMRPPGGHWAHEAMQYMQHTAPVSPQFPASSPHYRRLSQLFPSLFNGILAKSAAFSECLESHDDAERRS